MYDNKIDFTNMSAEDINKLMNEYANQSRFDKFQAIIIRVTLTELTHSFLNKVTYVGTALAGDGTNVYLEYSPLLNTWIVNTAEKVYISAYTIDFRQLVIELNDFYIERKYNIDDSPTISNFITDIPVFNKLHNSIDLINAIIADISARNLYNNHSITMVIRIDKNDINLETYSLYKLLQEGIDPCPTRYVYAYFTISKNSLEGVLSPDATDSNPRYSVYKTIDEYEALLSNSDKNPIVNTRPSPVHVYNEFEKTILPHAYPILDSELDVVRDMLACIKGDLDGFSVHNVPEIAIVLSLSKSDDNVKNTKLYKLLEKGITTCSGDTIYVIFKKVYGTYYTHINNCGLIHHPGAIVKRDTLVNYNEELLKRISFTRLIDEDFDGDEYHSNILNKHLTPKPAIEAGMEWTKMNIKGNPMPSNIKSVTEDSDTPNEKVVRKAVRTKEEELLEIIRAGLSVSETRKFIKTLIEDTKRRAKAESRVNLNEFTSNNSNYTQVILHIESNDKYPTVTALLDRLSDVLDANSIRNIATLIRLYNRTPDIDLWVSVLNGMYFVINGDTGSLITNGHILVCKSIDQLIDSLGSIKPTLTVNKPTIVEKAEPLGL